MIERYETRLVIVDESGRVIDRSNIRIAESIQDNGRTLKLFIKNADIDFDIVVPDPEE